MGAAAVARQAFDTQALVVMDEFDVIESIKHFGGG